MILGKINYKHLAIYGILKINNGYTVDKDNLRVNANVSISYNLSDIEQTIDNIQLKIEELDSDEDMTTEIKDNLNESYEEQLEILNTLKEKLS